MRWRDRSTIIGFWLLILGLTVARAAFHDRIVFGASHDGAAGAPALTRAVAGPG